METVLYMPFWRHSAGKTPPYMVISPRGRPAARPTERNHLMSIYDALDIADAASTASTASLCEAIDRLSWGVPPEMGYSAYSATEDMLAELDARA